MTSNDVDLPLRQRMIDEQLRPRGIVDENVLRVMLAVSRARFVPEAMRARAYDDNALHIAEGQTISQPFIVACMTQHLELNRGCRVLEIGTGTGYQTKILSLLARHVFSVERLASLHTLARRNLDDVGAVNVSLFLGDGTTGLPMHAPFDRIIVTAASPAIPGALVDQLADPGLLIIPVGKEADQTLVLLRRKERRETETPLLPCRFVKLIGKDGWSADLSPPATPA